MAVSEQNQFNIFPKISIITVTYNSGASLRRAFDSVIKQTYKNLEFIVIDGGSTDETLQIITDNKQHISYWVSEKDSGIYNAMNKGIGQVTGDLVYFLNSDDYFYDSQVLEEIAELYIKHNLPDVLYGDVITYSREHNGEGRSGRLLNLEKLKEGRVICHQSIFMRADVLRRYRFDESYRIAADYDLQIRCLKDNCRFVYINKIFAYYCIDGLSSSFTGKRATVHEKIQIIKSHFRWRTYYSFYLFARLKLIRMDVRAFLKGLTK